MHIQVHYTINKLQLDTLHIFVQQEARHIHLKHDIMNIHVQYTTYIQETFSIYVLKETMLKHA